MKLVPPQPGEWQRRFQAHHARILTALPGADVQHIGSTAIPGLQAKDVVDVLVGVPEMEISTSAAKLVERGYVPEGDKAGHAWLCWPAPEQCEAVIHVMALEGEAWRKRLYFRDYLRQHPAQAKAYQTLKQELAAQTDDWSEYTARKADFVARLLLGAF